LILRDPQTSGGLLVAVRPEKRDRLITALRQAGYTHTTVIGEVRDGTGLKLLPRPDDGDAGLL
jgi:selenophosphate synthase